MRLFIFLLLILISSTNSISQVREIVKVKIDGNCRECIGKRQFKDNLFTKPQKLISGLGRKASFSLNYIDNKEMFHFTFNEKMDLNFDYSIAFFTIDSIEYKFYKESFKTQTIDGLSKQYTFYIIGYNSNTQFLEKLIKSNSISISFINKNTQIRKTWDLSKKDIIGLKKMYNCYKKYSIPLINNGLHYKEPDLNTKIFKIGENKIDVIDSNTNEIKELSIKLDDEIFVTGLKNNRIEFVYDLNKYWYTIQNLDEIVFNYENNDIVNFISKLSNKDKELFKLFSNNLNKSFYDNKRKIELIEKEKRKKIEEEQNQKEALKLELYQKKIEEETKQSLLNCEKDIIISKNENDELISSRKTIKSAIDDVEKTILKCKSFGIILNNFEILEDDYNNVDLAFGIYNCTNKKIKYITFKVRAFNPVGDPVGNVETVKGIGFIEPFKTGSWEFERVWYSSIIEKVKILSITIIFEDETKKIINDVKLIRKDISSMILQNYNISKENLLNTQIIGPISLNIESNYISFKNLQLNNLKEGFIEDEGLIIIDDTFKSSLKTVINLTENETNTFESDNFKIIKNCKNVYLIDLINGAQTCLLLEDANELLKRL